MTPQQRIQIILDGPVNDIDGHTWPESGGVPLDFTAAEGDHEITIGFPSGRSWTTDSKITFFSQKDGHLASAVATPLDEAIDFNHALTRLRTATNELGIAEDTLVIKRLGEWLTKPPSWSPFSTKTVGAQLEPGITFFAEIKPATEDDNWYLSYHFTVDRFFADGSESRSSHAEEPAKP